MIIKTSSWRQVKGRIPNLNVLTANGIEVGFVEKPNDTKFDKNMWRCFIGIGENNRFLGHAPTKRCAQTIVESEVR